MLNDFICLTFYFMPVLGFMQIKIGLASIDNGDFMDSWISFAFGIITIVLGGFIAHYLQHITKENDRMDKTIEKFTFSANNLVNKEFCGERHKNLDNEIREINKKLDLLLNIKNEIC